MISFHLVSRLRSDEVNYARANGIPIPEDDVRWTSRDAQQTLDTLCLPRILDVKLNGAITHVHCLR